MLGEQRAPFPRERLHHLEKECAMVSFTWNVVDAIAGSLRDAGIFNVASKERFLE